MVYYTYVVCFAGIVVPNKAYQQGQSLPHNHAHARAHDLTGLNHRLYISSVDMKLTLTEGIQNL